MRRIFTLISVFFLIGLNMLFAQDYDVETKLTANDGIANDRFGRALAISGNLAVIGNAEGDINPNVNNSVYIYKFDGKNWIEQQILTPSYDSTAIRFGQDVAISGDLIVVGATYYDIEWQFFDDNNAGAAFVYRYNGSQWVEEQILLASDGFPNDQFGSAIAVDGNRIIVGTIQKDFAGFNLAGQAYIFEFNGNSWVESAILTAPVRENDHFGESVAISSDFAMVGADEDDEGFPQSGSVFAYRFDGNNWLYEQTLTASDRGQDDRFGNVIAMDSEKLIVGASQNDDNGSNSGSAYIFEYDGSNWVELQELHASDAAAGDRFGGSVSISGDKAIVGAIYNEAAYVFKWNGSSWNQESLLRATDAAAADLYGGYVAINKSLAFVGARSDDDNGTESGSVYIYELIAQPDITASSGRENNRSVINWQNRSSMQQGFRIYRDGDEIATAISGARSYNDYRAIPGVLHNYVVTAFNDRFGESNTFRNGKGWRKADGRIDGTVRTRGQAGAANVTVAVTPSSNEALNSLRFDGVDDFIRLPQIPLSEAMTITAWIKTSSFAHKQILSWGNDTNGHAIEFKIMNGNFAYRESNDFNGPGSEPVNEYSSSSRIDNGNWQHVAAVLKEDSLWLYVNGQQEIAEILTEFNANVNITTIGAVRSRVDLLQPFSGAIDEVQLWNRSLSADEINETMFKALDGGEEDLVSYWSFDDLDRTDLNSVGDYAIGGGNHGGVSGAVRSSDLPPGVSFSSNTDINGDYSIKNIFYAEDRDFDIIPSKPDHGFQPAQLSRNLDSNTPTMLAVNFTDTTSYTVSGRIHFENYASCAVPDVMIEVDGTFRGVTTNTDGEFRLSIDTPGRYTITPVLEDSNLAHGFEPAEIVVDVSDDISGLVFADTTTAVLSGYVGASCLYLGTAEINISTADFCFDTTITTNPGSGAFEVQLPAQSYTIAVDNLNYTDPNIIAPSSTVQNMNLTFQDSAEVDFIYHNPPQIRIVSGLPDVCSTIPVVRQYLTYPIVIEVFEEYVGEECIVDTGYLKIFDGVNDNTTDPTILPLLNGQAQYNMLVGEPNILEGGENPFQKLLQIEAFVDSQSANINQWFIVTGNKPRTSTFFTKTPSIPLLIVHDPPGDQSYAYFSEDSSFTTTHSTSYGWGGAGGVWWDAKHGFAIEEGFTGFKSKFAVVSEGQIIGGRDNTEQTSWTNTWQFTKTFQTSDGDAITGAQGDVFMGGAMNMKYALTDVIDFDSLSCSVIRDTAMVWGVQSFATTFIYTENHIRNTLLPQLKQIRSVASQDSVISLNMEISSWEQMLKYNNEIKEKAVFDKNISFSAGTNTEYSSSYSREDTWDFEFEAFVDGEIKLGLTNINEAGLWTETSFGILGQFRWSTTIANGRSDTKATTTGYVFSDDDIGDFFSVDVKKDKTYGTPVFNLVAGTSSCPWEKGTQPRDKPVININTFSQTGIDPNEPAAYILSLGNASESGETRDYLLSVVQSSNYDGAIIRVGGVVIEDHLAYTIPAGQSISATMSVERGPLAYDYNNLQLQLTSACDGEILETISFSVEYNNPGSNVDMFRPYNNWLINQSSSDSLLVTLRGFNRDDAILQSIALEYRKLGDSWKTVFLREKETLTENYINYYWDHGLLIDGEYELRAVANSSGKNYSQTSRGIIDRSALLAFGNPQPADRVLNLGENIQAFFTADLNCDAIIAGQNVALNDANGNPVSITTACNANSLIITATDSVLALLEGQLLTATIRDIEDVNGNPLKTELSWQFSVNQNQLYWVNADVNRTTYTGQSVQFMAELTNNGAIAEDFTISTLPAWLTALPMNGSISAGGSMDINFESDYSLNSAYYKDSVVVIVNSQGPELLHVKLNVLEAPPEWAFNSTAYQYSMNIIAQVSRENVVSENDKDIVAAFAGNEIRGSANLQFVSNQAGYLAFITVYSNQLSGETINFQTWDAANSQESGFVEQVVEFESNATIGVLESPLTLNASGRAQNINLNPEWTWFSLNLEQQDMSVNHVLAGIDASGGDILKGQQGISTYSGSSWVGDLDTLKKGASYSIFLSEQKDLRFGGEVVDLNEENISLLAGWNWIAYLPQQNEAIDSALSAFNAQNGDLLKSQSGFSVYDATQQKWQGAIAVMEPDKGYQLKTSGNGFISYAGVVAEEPVNSKTALPAIVVINEEDLHPQDFEFNMSLISTIRLGGADINKDHYSVSAYSADSIRGYGELIYYPAINKHMLFMTVYSNNVSGDSLRFVISNGLSKFQLPATNTLIFAADAVAGTLTNPYAISGFDDTPPILRSAFLYSSEQALADHIQFYVTANEPLLAEPLIKIVSPSGKEQTFTTEIFDAQENIYRLKYHIKERGENRFFVFASDLSENLKQEIRLLNILDISLNKNSIINLSNNSTLQLTPLSFSETGLFFGEYQESAEDSSISGLSRISGDFIFSASSQIKDGFDFFYDLSQVKMTKEEKRKINVYQYDAADESWIYVGSNRQEQRLHQAIGSMGKFALFYDENHIALPGDFRLLQNYPNPFNPRTTIEYELPQTEFVTLKIYNVRGQLVHTLLKKEFAAGYHSVSWDGRNMKNEIVASGIYFYQLRAGKEITSKKMIFIK